MSELKRFGGEISKNFKAATSDNFSADLAGKIGLGRYKAKTPEIDDTAFTDTARSQGLIDDLSKQRAGAQGRTFQGAEAARAGVSQKNRSAQVGDATRMRAAQLGDARNMSSAQLSNEQAEFRQGQQDLIADLQRQAAGEGPSLAGMQLGDARNQQIETAMALAASQRGLGAGAGLRQIADQTQNANQFAARESAKMRIAEQLQAQQQMQGALAGARAQDIGIASTQAGLDQQAAASNQAAQNQFALQQGAMSQQANAANAAALNQFALTQAGFDQQSGLANQNAANQFKLAQAGMDQQANIANMQGGLQFQGQQDNFTDALNRQISGLTMGQQGSLQDLERMKMQAALGLEGINSQSYGNQQSAITGLISGLAGGAAKAASAAASGGAAGV